MYQRTAKNASSHFPILAFVHVFGTGPPDVQSAEES